jgi:tetratricopeptide (TPR) repeat protein
MTLDSSQETLHPLNLHRAQWRCEQRCAKFNAFFGPWCRGILAFAALSVFASCQDDVQDNATSSSIQTTSPQAVATPTIEPALRDAWSFIEKGQLGIARMRIRGSVQDDAFTSQGAFLMGLTHHLEKHYGRGLTWFEQACNHATVYPPAWHFRGWALYWLGRPEDARYAFEQHLTLTPSEGDSHFGIGLIELESAHWNAAEVRFNTAINLQRDRDDRVDGVAKATARIAEVVEQRDGNLERAQALLADAINMQPNLYEAGFRRARLLRRLGRHNEADAVESAATVARDNQQANRS